MASPAELLALAEHVEAAKGPDRELDEAVFAALGWEPVPNPTLAGGLVGRWQRQGVMTGHDGPPFYTQSLDAAMKLAPDGYFRLNVTKDGAEALALTGSWVKAKTPALALTAACLRALASRGEG